jgi:hypothetical protein
MRRAAVLAATLLLVGCADLEPFDPPVADSLRPGPGLFSGPTGEFVLSRPWPGARETGDTTAAPAEPGDLTRPPPP